MPITTRRACASQSKSAETGSAVVFVSCCCCCCCCALPSNVTWTADSARRIVCVSFSLNNPVHPYSRQIALTTLTRPLQERVAIRVKSSETSGKKCYGERTMMWNVFKKVFCVLFYMRPLLQHLTDFNNVFTVTFSEAVFDMCSLLLDHAFQPATPLIDRAVDEALW